MAAPTPLFEELLFRAWRLRAAKVRHGQAGQKQGERAGRGADGVRFRSMKQGYSPPIPPAIPAGARVESTTARLWFFITAFTSVIPRTLRNLSSGTFIGPGPFAVPGTGCGNAVDIAVWNVTLPSTFCIT